MSPKTPACYINQEVLDASCWTCDVTSTFLWHKTPFLIQSRTLCTVAFDRQTARQLDKITCQISKTFLRTKVNYYLFYCIHLGQFLDWNNACISYNLIWYPTNIISLHGRHPMTLHLCSAHSLLHVTAFWLKSCNTCKHACGKSYKWSVQELISMHSDVQTQNTDAVTGHSWLCADMGCAIHGVEIQTSKHHCCVSCSGSGNGHCACYWHPEVIELEIHEYVILNIQYNFSILLSNTKRHA